MPQSINRGRSQELIVKGLFPLGEIQIAGEDSGLAFVPFSHVLLEVFVAGWADGLEAEVIDDQQGHPAERLEPFCIRPCGFGRLQAG